MNPIKFFIILFTFCINDIILTTEDAGQSLPQKREFKELRDTCTINIHSVKLQAANSSTSIQDNQDQVSLELKKLYEQCESIINDSVNYPHQPKLPENIWINKSLNEIYILQYDDETRNCFNEAITSVKELNQAQTEEEKNLYIKRFHEKSQKCHQEDALRIGTPHLIAQIERWQNNPQSCTCDIKSFTFFVKHGQKEEAHLEVDLEVDLENLYNQCNIPTPLETFKVRMKNALQKIKNDKKSQKCLNDLIQFKADYDKALTPEDRDKLIKNFAIPYFECKNR